MTDRQRKALKTVKLRTLDHVLAVRSGDVEDFELAELERSQARAAREALQVGCQVDAVVAAQKAGGYSALASAVAEVA